MTSAADKGSQANTCPRFSTFGQEIFTSIPITPGISLNLSATLPNSSTLFPAIETMVRAPFCCNHFKSFSMKSSIPGPCKPIPLSIPLGVSAIRGVARPDLGLSITLLVTTAPIEVMSIN